jgi:hypothetical protein
VSLPSRIRLPSRVPLPSRVSLTPGACLPSRVSLPSRRSGRAVTSPISRHCRPSARTVISPSQAAVPGLSQLGDIRLSRFQIAFKALPSLHIDTRDRGDQAGYFPLANSTARAAHAGTEGARCLAEHELVRNNQELEICQNSYSEWVRAGASVGAGAAGAPWTGAVPRHSGRDRRETARAVPQVTGGREWRGPGARVRTAGAARRGCRPGREPRPRCSRPRPGTGAPGSPPAPSPPR